MRSGAVLAIDGYRRFLSPYKGFSCAHNRIYDQGSCSDFGREAFAQHGIRRGWHLMRMRFAACKSAAASMHAMVHAAGPKAQNSPDGNATPQSEETDDGRKKRSSWNCASAACDAPGCAMPNIECGAPAGAIDMCSLGDACACGV